MKEYTIKTNTLGQKIFTCKISWIDEEDNLHKQEYNDPEEAETLLGLLTGNITLEDLKP